MHLMTRMLFDRGDREALGIATPFLKCKAMLENNFSLLWARKTH